MTIANRELSSAYDEFRSMVESAEPDLYTQERFLLAAISDAMDAFMNDLQGAGLTPNNCDGAYNLECAMFAYAKESK